MKKVSILGSTGSIGTQTLNVVSHFPDEFKIIGLSVNSNIELLEKQIKEVADLYDFILIDNPPSLGLLTINGLVASREIIIPVQCEYYALEGLSQLLNTIGLIKEHLQPELEILGAVMTMYDGRNKLSNDVFNDLYKNFPARIFRSVIPRNVKVAESPSHGSPLKDYAPNSVGSNAYKRLAQEVILAK